MITTLLTNRTNNNAKALTLVEMMTTMGIFSLVVMGMIYAHIFGLRQDQLVESKLGASESARKGFNLISRDIRSAKRWQIGNMSGNNFVDIPDGTLQRGGAVQLNLTTNTAISVYYFFTNMDDDFKLCRFRTGDLNYTVLASNLFNRDLYFAAEDYRGSNMTTLEYRYVIRFALQFQQYQYPLTKVGTNYLYDYYRLEFKLTPHAPS